MRQLDEEIINFLESQGYVIVSTIDKDGFPHSSCKGIVKIEKTGKIYLLDVYKGRTYENLKYNHHISITAVDEHRFIGFCLKGEAKIKEAGLQPHILKAWEDKIVSRSTQRLLRNIKGQKGHLRHPEVLLPVPKYLIEVEIKQIVNLTPQALK